MTNENTNFGCHDLQCHSQVPPMPQPDSPVLPSSPGSPLSLEMPTSVPNSPPPQLPTPNNNWNNVIPMRTIKGRLEGKVAIVAESTRGIGLSIAERLAMEGARIDVSSGFKKGINEAVERLRAREVETTGFACDISKAEGRKALIDKTVEIYGHIDIIVYNTTVQDMPMDVKLQSSAALLKEAEGKLLGGSSFIFVSTTKSDESEILTQEIKSLANDMSQKQVRVNCVASLPVLMSADKINKAGRVTVEERMAAAAALLASGEAIDIRGVTMIVAEETIPRFVGKVAIVRESTKGIGFSIAEQLGIEGASVVVSSRFEDKVSEAVEKLKAKNIEVTGFACDVSKDEGRKNLIDRTVETYGKIDVIVSNTTVLDMPLDINLPSSLALLKEAADKLHFGCSFVLVAATKPNKPENARAIIRHIKSIAHVLSSKKIRVNCVASISERQLPPDRLREEEKEKIVHNAVAAALWLASHSASEVTGTGVTMMVTEDIPSSL